MVKIKKIADKPLNSILKNSLYLNGIIVSDRLFELLNNSQYKGYRTTMGIFMKLGATLSRQEFEKIKLNNTKIALLTDDSESISYDEYLKIREYTTAILKREKFVNKENLKNKSYFMLDINKEGKIYIIGQYVDKNIIYHIKLEDCGVFLQEKYKDNPVILQAGGIRLRVSISGANCISGCSFCDFGNSYKNYINNTLNQDFKDYITNEIKQLTLNKKVQTLFITGGNPSLKDMKKWTEFVVHSIDVFKKYIPNGSVDVMLTPRGFDNYVYDNIVRYKEYKKYLEFLKSISVNTISPNMELWTQEELNRFCSISTNGVNFGTTKSEIGHDGYIDFIKAGINVFGKYNIRSSLIVGLNSNGNVKKAIKDLTKLGCYVILSPFKAPNKGFNKLEPSINDVIELSSYLEDETDKILRTFPKKLRQTYKERIGNLLNAHNSHNTANLCCGQSLDVIEKEILRFENDNHIVSKIN